MAKKFWGVGTDALGQRVSDATDAATAVAAAKRGYGRIDLYEYDEEALAGQRIGELVKVIAPVPKENGRE